MNTKERYGALLNLTGVDDFLVRVGDRLISDAAGSNKGVEVNVNGLPYGGKTLVAEQFTNLLTGCNPHPLVARIRNYLQETGHKMVVVFDEFDEYLKYIEGYEEVAWGNIATHHKSSDWALATTSEVMMYADRKHIYRDRAANCKVLHIRTAPVITYPDRDLGGRAQIDSVSIAHERGIAPFVVVVIGSPTVEKRAEKFRKAVAEAVDTHDLVKFERVIKSLKIDLGAEIDVPSIVQLKEGMATVGAANMVKGLMVEIIKRWSQRQKSPLLAIPDFSASSTSLFRDNLLLYSMEFCERYMKPSGADCLVAVNDVQVGYLRDVIHLHNHPRKFRLPVKHIVEKFFKEYPQKLPK